MDGQLELYLLVLSPPPPPEQHGITITNSCPGHNNQPTIWDAHKQTSVIIIIKTIVLSILLNRNEISHLGGHNKTQVDPAHIPDSLLALYSV